MEEAVSIQRRIAIDTSDETQSRISESFRSKPESLTVDLSDVTLQPGFQRFAYNGNSAPISTT